MSLLSKVFSPPMFPVLLIFEFWFFFHGFVKNNISDLFSHGAQKLSEAVYGVLLLRQVGDSRNSWFWPCSQGIDLRIDLANNFLREPMIHPDGFRPSSLLFDKDAPGYIWLFACLKRSFLLAIIMNLVHEKVFLVNTASKHTFFDDDSHCIWVLRQNRIFVSWIFRP